LQDFSLARRTPTISGMRRLVLALAILALAPGTAGASSSGGTAPVVADWPGGADPAATQPAPSPGSPAAPGPVGTVSGAMARLAGAIARAPRRAPAAVRLMIAAGNALQDKPYRYGGGHEDFVDEAYDCSGTVSYALHAAGVLDAPVDSTGLMTWGEEGPGRWVSIYANPDHAFMVIAGLRLDTSGSGGRGPRWNREERDLEGFEVRHPPGL